MNLREAMFYKVQGKESKKYLQKYSLPTLALPAMVFYVFKSHRFPLCPATKFYKGKESLIRNLLTQPPYHHFVHTLQSNPKSAREVQEQIAKAQQFIYACQSSPRPISPYYSDLSTWQ